MRNWIENCIYLFIYYLTIYLFIYFSGGWQGRGLFKATFNSGGAIEFAEHFRRAVTAGESKVLTSAQPFEYLAILIDSDVLCLQTLQYCNGNCQT